MIYLTVHSLQITDLVHVRIIVYGFAITACWKGAIDGPQRGAEGEALEPSGEQGRDLLWNNCWLPKFSIAQSNDPRENVELVVHSPQ